MTKEWTDKLGDKLNFEDEPAEHPLSEEHFNAAQARMESYLAHTLITGQDVFQVTGKANYACDASELRWPPGHWPEVVNTDLGNGKDMDRMSLDDSGARYKQRDSDVNVWVLND